MAFLFLNGGIICSVNPSGDETAATYTANAARYKEWAQQLAATHIKNSIQTQRVNREVTYPVHGKRNCGVDLEYPRRAGKLEHSWLALNEAETKGELHV